MDRGFLVDVDWGEREAGMLEQLLAADGWDREAVSGLGVGEMRGLLIAAEVR